jgi:Holliday junction resolvase RusA-like endonuclease
VRVLQLVALDEQAVEARSMSTTQLVDDAVRFVVFGRPQGKGSKRVLPVRSSGKIVLVDSNRNARPWANRVADSAAEAMRRDKRSGLVRSAVSVELLFCFLRPKGHYGSGRNAAKIKRGAPSHMVTMPDVDKLCRCALDALTGVVIVDDSQIVELIASKVYSEPERCEVSVRAL